jgi:hypothetical protein
MSITYTAENVRNGAYQTNGKTRYLTKAIDTKAHVDCPPEYAGQAAAFTGKAGDFIAAHNNDPNLTRQLQNKVKVCPACSKPCAFTLSTCNSCSGDISTTPITFTNNIFMSFVFGFGFKICIRHQDAKGIVFDDLLALTTCHLNTIPTDNYLPDWRYLLTRPVEGLALLNRLYDNCFNVLKTQFMTSTTWRQKYLRNADNLSDADLKGLIAAGFNFPPSQYQLHLQFMLLPLTPFHYSAYLKGHHYTKGRFFPYEYARAVLELGVAFPVTETTTVEEITTFYEAKGVSYNAIFDANYARYGQAHERVANYDAKDFGGFADEKEFFAFGSTANTASAEPADLAALKNADKAAIQNYGRPLDTSGAKPVFYGTFYGHPKSPGDLVDWTL